MTRNVTLRMDEDLLTELRNRAVDARMSLSAWITVTLKHVATGSNDMERKRKRALARLERGFNLGGKPIPREELHVR